MLLDPYYSKENNIIKISALQASSFAKQECNDFNPLHDVQAKRFCVPGDLLSSLALLEYGVSESMSFTFTNMVGDNVGLIFPETDSNHIVVTTKSGKSILEISRSGKINTDTKLIESLIKNYVRFSGQNFPSLLMPLMKKHQVMFNPARPLVMYNSMSFEFDNLVLDDKMQVKLSSSEFVVQGKRADNFLYFELCDGDTVIGRGIKKMVVAGLKPYDHQAITDFSEAYEDSRNTY